jgi:endonuclease YncB( thermonuclease family)
MMNRPRSRLFLLLLAVIAVPFSRAAAQQCSKGKPCGNTCIARSKVCRVGPGTARWAPGADTTAVATQQGRAAPPFTDTAAVHRVLETLPAAKRSSCTVTSITDGDTFRCGSQRIRLLSIDAPETDQGPFGATATRGLRALIETGTVVVLERDVEERDRYGRTLAYAYLPDGRMVNEEMARLGLAVVSVYPPNVRHVDRMRAAVRDALAAKRGLWATRAFECLPADHRRGRC